MSDILKGNIQLLRKSKAATEWTKDRRIGKFLISRLLIEDGTAFDILNSVLGVRAEMFYHNDSVEYIAFGPDFDVLSEGETAPYYTVLCTCHSDGSESWEWQKADD